MQHLLFSLSLTFFSAHERSELILIAEGLVSVADGLSLMMMTINRNVYIYNVQTAQQGF